jgi:predicted MFS family arabinose efflux permease
MRGASPWALALGGLFALAAALGIGRFVYTPILPLMMGGLGWSASDAGFVASANFLGYLVGALIAARATVVPAARRAWLLGALALSAATTGAMAADVPIVALGALRFAGGVASAFVIVMASALVLDRVAALGRPELSSVHFAGVGTGIAAASVALDLVSPSSARWDEAWLVAGGMSLVCAILAAALLPPRQALPATGPAASPAGGELKGLGPLIVAYGLFGFGYVITATFIVTMVRGDAGLAALESSIWIAFGLAAMPSVWLWTRLGARLGNLAAFAVACVAEAAGVAASVAWRTPEGLFLSSAVLGGTFMGITALGLMAARQTAGAAAQRALALMTASFGLGQMIGPALAGWAFERTASWRAPTLLASLALVVAAALAVRLARRRPTV